MQTNLNDYLVTELDSTSALEVVGGEPWLDHAINCIIDNWGVFSANFSKNYDQY